MIEPKDTLEWCFTIAALHFGVFGFLYAIPSLFPLGPVGELFVDASQGAVTAHTMLPEMKERAWKLYEQYRGQIDAPLS